MYSEDYVVDENTADRVAQTFDPTTSIRHEIGVPSAEADDTTIDMEAQREPATQEVLAGLVEQVTFHNDDNGFCVLRIKAQGSPRPDNGRRTCRDHFLW